MTFVFYRISRPRSKKATISRSSRPLRGALMPRTRLWQEPSPNLRLVSDASESCEESRIRSRSDRQYTVTGNPSNRRRTCQPAYEFLPNWRVSIRAAPSRIGQPCEWCKKACARENFDRVKPFSIRPPETPESRLPLIGSVLRLSGRVGDSRQTSAWNANKLSHAYGAKITYSDPLEGSDGAIRLCREILEDNPDRYFKPDQYFNPMNPQAHYETTGPEIYRQTRGKFTHFVAGIGTGGTMMGTGRYLKEVNPKIQNYRRRTRRRAPWPRRIEAHGQLHCPGHLSRRRTGRQNLGFNRRRLCDGLSFEPRRRNFCRPVVGRRHVCRLESWHANSATGTIVTVFPDFGDKYLRQISGSVGAIGWRSAI